MSFRGSLRDELTDVRVTEFPRCRGEWPRDTGGKRLVVLARGRSGGRFDCEYPPGVGTVTELTVDTTDSGPRKGDVGPYSPRPDAGGARNGRAYVPRSAGAPRSNPQSLVASANHVDRRSSNTVALGAPDDRRCSSQLVRTSSGHDTDVSGAVRSQDARLT